MESLKTYTYCRKAQYHETDQMGIIHHSNYVKWMEEARIGYMNQMGFSYKKVEELGVISPVVEISVAYKKQVFFDDELQVRVSIKKYNGRRQVRRRNIRKHIRYGKENNRGGK